MVSLRTTDDLLGALEEHAQEEAPLECVGLVLANGTVIKLKNQAQSEHRFFVAPQQFEDRHDEFDAPAGVLYHSHPHREAIPSGEDERMMMYLAEVWPWCYHIILSPHGHRAYHVVNGQVQERPLWDT
jgi:proteasome lid subunit RPN8/RPN11